jgi:ABC-2 type transport system permease protein
VRHAVGYWKSATMAATSVLADGPLLLVDYLLRFARVVVLLSLWRLLFGDQAAVGGMTLAAVLTYTLIGEVLREQLDVRAGIDEAMWNGSIATRALRPGAIVGHFVGEMAGRWWLGVVLCSIPLLLLSPALGVDPLPAGLPALALFVPSLILSITVGLALEFLFGGLTVALSQPPWLMSAMKNAIAVLLSGLVIPLPLLPWGLGEVFRWLPFAATAAAPLQVYTGAPDAIALVGAQLIWAVVLWPLVGWVWRSHREQVAIYGG